MNFAMLIRIWSLPNQDPVLNQISYQGSINRGSCLDYAHCSIGHGIPNLSLRSFSSRKFCIDLSHFGFQLITPTLHFWHPSARCFERSQRFQRELLIRFYFHEERSIRDCHSLIFGPDPESNVTMKHLKSLFSNITDDPQLCDLKTINQDPFFIDSVYQWVALVKVKDCFVG